MRVIVAQETKRDTTETKQDKAETKPKKSSINKKNKQTLTKRIFFYMRQQSTKCQWRIEKLLTFTGRFGYGRKK